MFRRSYTVLLLALGAALAVTSAQAGQRTFVASFGSDANAATSCVFSAPCRSFATAITVTDAGGEVLALDSIGYGSVVIDRSITLTAAPGAYAGISVGAGGTGVTIATAGVNVTLRGLNINNVGGSFGITMTNGARLSIENCVISNFSNLGGYGVSVNAAARVRIVDSLIRDNYDGVILLGGATGDIANSKFLGNGSVAIYVRALTASTTTTAAVTDSVVSGNFSGIGSISSNATGITRVSVIRTMVSNNTQVGVGAQSDFGALAVLTISDSMVTGNTTGLGQFSPGAVVETLGNNAVRQNGSATSGTITAVSPM